MGDSEMENVQCRGRSQNEVEIMQGGGKVASTEYHVGTKQNEPGCTGIHVKLGKSLGRNERVAGRARGGVVGVEG
jgi:hypothetical protein